MKLHLDLQNPNNFDDVPSQTQFEKWVTCALQHIKCSIQEPELTIRIVDADESSQLNCAYRNKNKPTNVLSFPFEVPEQIECDLLGDLVICQPVMQKEAIAQNKLELDHWAHLVVHGTLHLLGFDHVSDSEAEEMESLEVEILEQLNIQNPYL